MVCRWTGRFLLTLLAGLFWLQANAAAPWRPMPDASFGVFLDTGSLQDFMTRLPVPARDALRKQAGPVAAGEGVVVAFLGASAVPAELRIDRVETNAGRLNVHLALRRAETEPGAPAHPYYPLATARLRHLPRIPFDVHFIGEEGETVAALRGIRPPLVSRGDASTTGDPWGVTRRLERKVERRCGHDCPTPPGPGAVVGRGRNLVRVHDTRVSLFYTPYLAKGGRMLWLGGPLPRWMRPARSRCRLTDRTPEAIADARAGGVPVLLEDVLTIKGEHRVLLGDNMLSGKRGDVRLPERAWLACDWSQPSQGLINENLLDLGTWVIDLYPAELHFRQAGTMEITRVVEAYHDLTLRFRLFPPFLPDRGRNVPIRLLIHAPPPLPGMDAFHRLGAFLYSGFDRDPNRGAYVVHPGKDESGDWYTWLAVQDPDEAFDYELQARLALCRTSGTENRLGDDACNTTSGVQAFYTHAGFLQSHRLQPPVRLRLSLRSPWGYGSQPFEVMLGDEPDTPWAARRMTERSIDDRENRGKGP